MLLRLIVILFLIYVVVRLFQRFDNFLKGRNRPSDAGRTGRDIPPRRQDRYRDRIEDARWEDVSDPPQHRR